MCVYEMRKLGDIVCQCKCGYLNLLIPNLLLKKNVQDDFNYSLDEEKQNSHNILSYNEIIMCKSYTCEFSKREISTAHLYYWLKN